MTQPTPRRPGRPAGTLGECGRAFLAEAQRQPGTVRQIAERALVGVPVATQLAKRLVASGTLRPLTSPGTKPAVLGPPSPEPEADEGTAGKMFLVLQLSQWQRQAAAAAHTSAADNLQGAAM